jgi:adenylate cyclase
MRQIAKHWQRIAVTLIPVLIALLHAAGTIHIGVIQRLDDIIYDARLRATMPNTMDDRIVIVDLDEKSLGAVGRWPWSRNKLAEMMDILFDKQHIALLGFDVVFAEPDDSSGLFQLNKLARNELKDQPGFAEKLERLQESLDFDGRFAKALENRPIVMGFYLTGDRGGNISGVLPEPVFSKSDLHGRRIDSDPWSG